MFDTTKTITMMIVNPDSFGTLSAVRSTVVFEAVRAELLGNLQNAFEETTGMPIDWATSLLSDHLGGVANEILKRYGIKEDKLSYYRFRVNPIRTQEGHKKIIDSKLTGGGFDLDTRGTELIQKRFQCTTGSLIPVEVVSLVTDLAIKVPVVSDVDEALRRNPKLSGSYVKFTAFKQFWQLHNDDLLFLFEDDAYLGRIGSLDIDEDASRPYEITFSFDLQIYPGKSFNLYTGYVNEDLFQSFKSTRNLEKTDSSYFNDTIKIPPTGEITPKEQSLLNDYGSGSTAGLKPKNNEKAKSPTKKIALKLTDPLQLSRYLKDINKSDIDIFEDVTTFNVFTYSSQEIEVTSSPKGKGSGESSRGTEKEILNSLPWKPL